MGNPGARFLFKPQSPIAQWPTRIPSARAIWALGFSPRAAWRTASSLNSRPDQQLRAIEWLQHPDRPVQASHGNDNVWLDHGPRRHPVDKLFRWTQLFVGLGFDTMVNLGPVRADGKGKPSVAQRRASNVAATRGCADRTRSRLRTGAVDQRRDRARRRRPPTVAGRGRARSLRSIVGIQSEKVDAPPARN